MVTRSAMRRVMKRGTSMADWSKEKQDRINCAAWSAETIYRNIPETTEELTQMPEDPNKIPEEYVREMIADWIGAGMAYNPAFRP